MKYLFCLSLCLVTFVAFGQRQELLDELSAGTCECLKDANPDASFEMTIGLCMLQASGSRSDEIKDVLGIDLTNLDNYEALGEAVAPSLMANCPTFMTMMLEAAGNGELDELLDDDEEIEEVPGWDELFEEEEGGEGEWSDMEAASDGDPEYGGAELKEFITSELENTNGSGLTKPTVAGSVKTVTAGLANEILIRDEGGQSRTLYLTRQVPGSEKLKKGARVVITYRSTMMYHAGNGRDQAVWVITKVE